jgi:two-component system OmpR family response regulator
MRLGATDYMLKDTTTLDFLPVRVKALWDWIDKIKKPGLEKSDVVCGPLTLNEDNNEVFWDGVPVRLTLTEFWILQSLAKRPGNLKSHGQLKQAAQAEVEDNTIVATVRRIRGKFKEIDPKFDCIKTEYGMGYRWVK